MASQGQRGDVSARSRNARRAEQEEEGRAPLKSLQAQPVFCGVCGLEIIKTLPWFQCVDCSKAGNDTFLCKPCFQLGKKSKTHDPAEHAYKVMDSPHVPVTCPEWTAQEEILLFEGIDLCGFGNWEGVSDHISLGRKTAKQCEEHYVKHYLRNPEVPGAPRLSDEEVAKIEEAHEKQVKIDEKLRQIQEELPGMPGADLQGYIPLREDFDREFVNDAEQLLADLSFTKAEMRVFLSSLEEEEANAEEDNRVPDRSTKKKSKADENPSEREWDDDVAKANLKMKLDLLNSYNKKIEERLRRKEFVKERELLRWRERHRVWRSSSKLERLVRCQLRPLERFSTPEQHEQLVLGITRELEVEERLEHLRTGSSASNSNVPLSQKPQLLRANSYGSQGSTNFNSTSTYSSLSRSERSRKRRRGTAQAEDEEPCEDEMRDIKQQNEAQEQVALPDAVMTETDYNICRALKIKTNLYRQLKQVLIQDCRDAGVLENLDTFSTVQLDFEQKGKQIDVKVKYLQLPSL